MTKRYIVTGSHGVGKTTLIDAWAQAHSTPTTRLVPEAARKLAAEGYQVSATMEEPGFRRYLEVQLHALNNQAELVIFDRGLFDASIYTANYPPTQLNPQYQAILAELVRLESQLVDGYIYVPIEFPLQTDGLRPSEVGYQQEIDQRVQQVLAQLQKPLFKVSGSLAERVQQLQRAITEVG